jgi:hypothetical protein
VIGDARATDTPADDHDGRGCRQCPHPPSVVVREFSV